MKEAVKHVIDVMAMVMKVMDIVYRIEAVLHLIDVMAMVMDIVIGLKLYCL